VERWPPEKSATTCRRPRAAKWSGSSGQAVAAEAEVARGIKFNEDRHFNRVPARLFKPRVKYLG